MYGLQRLFLASYQWANARNTVSLAHAARALAIPYRLAVSYAQAGALPAFRVRGGWALHALDLSVLVSQRHRTVRTPLSPAASLDLQVVAGDLRIPEGELQHLLGGRTLRPVIRRHRAELEALASLPLKAFKRFGGGTGDEFFLTQDQALALIGWTRRPEKAEALRTVRRAFAAAAEEAIARADFIVGTLADRAHIEDGRLTVDWSDDLADALCTYGGDADAETPQSC